MKLGSLVASLAPGKRLKFKRVSAGRLYSTRLLDVSTRDSTLGCIDSRLDLFLRTRKTK